MCFRGMGYLPLFLVVLSVATFVVTYIIAICNKDVAPEFPYISDTGTKPPESCIFSQFLNISAMLVLCTIYVRYKLVESLCGNEDSKLRRLNKVGLVLGVLCALGLSIVANFQETSVEIVHVIGASLVFGVGVIYAAIQTALTYHMYPDFNGIYICRVRLTLTVSSLILMVLTFTSAALCRTKMEPGTDKFHWKPDQPGYTEHLISTIGEWLTAIVYLFYFLTFVRDFMKLKIEVRPQVYVRHLDEDPIYPDEHTPLLS